MLVDIGDKTIERHTGIIHQAETVFINGPPGIYDEAVSAPNTEQLLTAVAEGSGCLIIGGGDGVATTGGLRC
ncbi:MAG: phosphoglycerate kinase [Anaerolineales bacterium]|nr:MAG: phosphoglycerate kinase [Anaerolineales bacterium]